MKLKKHLLLTIFTFFLLSGFTVHANAAEKLSLSLNGVTLSEINSGSKETKYEGNTLTVNDTTTVTDVEIKGRGNSTWKYIKKPYQLKLAKKSDIFGLGKTKTYILLANYLDITGLRNDTALYTASKMNIGFSNVGKWVNLYEGEDYKGLYYVCKKNKIGDTELNLTDEKAVIVCMDEEYDMSSDDVYQKSAYFNRPICVKDAACDEEEGLSHFMASYNLLEKYAREKDYEKIKEIADVESFAKYYVLQEFTKNIDGWHKSVYMYKDGEEDLIHAGPAWDYDCSFGSEEHSWTNEGRDVLSYNNSTWNWSTSTLYRELVQIPEFRELVRREYQESLKPYEEDILARIDTQATLIADDVSADAALYTRKFKVKAENEKLRVWIVNRFSYMDKLYSSEVTLEPGSYEVGDTVVNVTDAEDLGEYYLTNDGSSYYLFTGELGEYVGSAAEIKEHAHTFKSTVTKAGIHKNGTVKTTCSKCGCSSTKTIYGVASVNISNVTYTGSVNKPKVTVTDKKGTTIPASNYKVSYKNNRNVGTATVTVTMKGNYSGTVSKTCIVRPKGTSIAKLTPAAKAFTIKVKAQKVQTTGYQIQYATKADMSDRKTVTINKNTVTSRKITGLKSGKTYYVRVRTYKRIRGKNYYSVWTTKKPVKIK